MLKRQATKYPRFLRLMTLCSGLQYASLNESMLMTAQLLDWQQEEAVTAGSQDDAGRQKD